VKAVQLDELTVEVLAFRAGCGTVVMATADATGHPEASYAPYVTDDDGRFFVFLSALASHTRHVEESGVVSLLFIEDECKAREAFARRRLTVACVAKLIARDAEAWRPIMDRFAERFGAVVGVLRALPDFRLFMLEPRAATYVRGFGQAYRLAVPGLEVLAPLGAGRPG
jgi:putative heme iron utilization protein